MCRVSEGVFRDEYCEADDGTASEVDDVVDCDHFQVQNDCPRSFDRPSQDQRSADVACLLLKRKRELNTKQTSHMTGAAENVIYTTGTDKPGFENEGGKKLSNFCNRLRPPSTVYTKLLQELSSQQQRCGLQQVFYTRYMYLITPYAGG